MRSVELVWNQKWHKDLGSDVSLFYNRVTDLIVRRVKGKISLPGHWGDPNPLVEWNDNSGELRSYGMDSQIHYSLGKSLSGYVNYSLINGYTTHPEQTYAGETFDLFKISTHKVMLGTTLKTPVNLSVTPRIRWVSEIGTRPENSKYGRSNPNSGKHEKMSGYTLIDLNLVYTYKNLDVNLLVNNLFNNKYYTSGVATESGVYLPEVPQNLRRILGGVTYHF